MIVSFLGFAAIAALFFLTANLVGASSLPTIIRADPRKPPYRFLKITMRGRAKDTGLGNGLTVYRELFLSFFYGPQAGVCNPPANIQSQKISLVQGAAGYTAPVPGAVTVAAGVITAVATGTGGTGVMANPLVVVVDATGSGAVITPTIVAGVVTGYTVTAGGTGYTAPTVLVFGNGGFQNQVAAPLVQTVFAKDWINDGIYAQWIDSPNDIDLQVGLTGPGVVPAGGYLTPTGDGGVGALGQRLPLDNNVTVHKYTGEKGRSWSGKAWHPTCVPITFFTNDDMNAIGKAAWNQVKGCFYAPITDGQSTLYPVLISQSKSQLSVNPTVIASAPLILPGTDVVRGVSNPVVNYTIGESRRRKEKHGLTF